MKTILVLGLSLWIGVSLAPTQGQCACPSGYLEADVFPPFETGWWGGDGEIRYLDWLYVLFDVLHLREPLDACEFSAADCAPRATLGDGLITTADFVQAWRYSIGWDAPQSVGGPTNPVPTLPLPGCGPRSVEISGDKFVRGADSSVTVRLLAAGDEYAVGFTVEFDPTQLQLRTALTNDWWPINTSLTEKGRVAFVAMATPESSAFAPGTNDLLRLTFHVLDWTNVNTTIRFSDALAQREICSTNADPLQTTFQAGTFDFVANGPRFDSLSYSSNSFRFLFVGEIGGHYLIETSTNLAYWLPYMNFTNNTAAKEIVDEVSFASRRYYRAMLVP